MSVQSCFGVGRTWGCFEWWVGMNRPGDGERFGESCGVSPLY